MHILSILGHKHTQTNALYRPFWILPLGIFTVVSLLPGNALAFESNLANASSRQFVAETQLYREREAAQPLQDTYAHRSIAILATSSPVTQAGTWASLHTPEPQNIQLASRVIPVQGAPVVLEGEASYYSRAGCLGCNPLFIMANGQPLNDAALTMAIGADKKHLVGYQARVTSLVTGKSVVVKITDTGGFYKAKYGNRVADLSVATKQAIGMAGGTGQVRVEVF